MLLSIFDVFIYQQKLHMVLPYGTSLQFSNPRKYRNSNEGTGSQNYVSKYCTGTEEFSVLNCGFVL